MAAKHMRVLGQKKDFAACSRWVSIHGVSIHGDSSLLLIHTELDEEDQMTPSHIVGNITEEKP
jgi:hypothetical protein